jgi:solute carrier family 13 (sodium-dependent dicarboxylate transporter), member 2/3/5
LAVFSRQKIKLISLLAGLAIALLLYFLNPFRVDAGAVKVLAVAGLMITWWVTEALPMPVVALVPLVLFPLFKIASMEEAASPYANPVIFLFMGGFMIGLAIEKWNLHRRIALNIIRLTGTSGDRIVLGFILATGVLSMWLSNTATTMMMFPIALSVIKVMTENNKNEGNIANFSLTIMLAIAYASNIGGIATVIGTPPNVAYVAYIEKKYSYSVGFINWMAVCTPLAIVLLFSLYWVMVKWLFPNRIKSDMATRQLIKDELAALGPVSVNEKRVLIIFIGTALLWITKDIINAVQPVLKLNDSMIAVIGAIALFICPADGDGKDAILEWDDTQRMAWGILLLFGGGISLANGLENAGLMQQLGQWLSQFGQNEFMLVLVITIVTMFLSEVMSNVAQVIVFAPVVSSMADAMGINPLLLGVPMTLAASCASMLPMGTPPNAIVFASGHIKLRQMTKAGFVMNIVAIVLITLFCWFLLPLLLHPRA